MKSFPTIVAIKIHRRKYGLDACREILVNHEVGLSVPQPEALAPLLGAFADDGRLCLVYEMFGECLDDTVEKAILDVGKLQHIARQSLLYLEHLHRLGWAHTDLKPDNMLYDSALEQVRIIDLGNAERRFKRRTPLATREYTPPEVILGSDLSTAVDLWSLGCTLFQLLTGEYLFDPSAAAEAKYQEFSDGPDDSDDCILDEDVDEEADADNSEQLEPGTVLQGKYRIESILGQGHFATVWKASVINDRQLLDDLSAVPDRARMLANARSHELAMTQSQEEDQVCRLTNRRSFGVTDAYDLALNYEHLLLIQETLGAWNPGWAKQGDFARVFCNEAGNLKFDTISPNFTGTLGTRLQKCDLSSEDSRLLESFLRALLAVQPEHRVSASGALAHPWLTHCHSIKKPMLVG